MPCNACLAMAQNILSCKIPLANSSITHSDYTPHLSCCQDVRRHFLSSPPGHRLHSLAGFALFLKNQCAVMRIFRQIVLSISSVIKHIGINLQMSKFSFLHNSYIMPGFVSSFSRQKRKRKGIHSEPLCRVLNGYQNLFVLQRNNHGGDRHATSAVIV